MKKRFKIMVSMMLAVAMLLTMPGFGGFNVSTGTVKAAEKYKVVCVGGSTTFMEYPNYLQNILGDEYEVINRGQNSTTATYIESLDKHDVNSSEPDGIFDGKSYRVTSTYQAAINDNPDCVIIMIGGNDAKTNNWEKVEEATGMTPEEKFEEDYRWLVNQFRNLSSNPDIIIATTGWAQNDGLFTIVNKYVDKVVPIQKKVAEELNLQMVDINAKTKGQDDIYSDGIHYNQKGYQLLADSFAPVVRELNSSEKCDLQVTEIKTDKTYNIGEEAKFCVTIKNTGSVATPAEVKHGVPVSVDGVCVAWCDTYFGPMEPGEEKTVEMNWGPNEKATWTVTEGTHTITAYVDDSRLISEANEDNNEMSVSMTFKKEGQAQASLKTVYDEPAGGENWYDEMVPLGNGMIGASVYGGVESDEILINEKTLWSGGSQEYSDQYPDYEYNGGFSSPSEALESYSEKAQSSWKQARQDLQAAVNTHSADGSEDYDIPQSVTDTINEMKGDKTNFGSYQELGSIFMQDPEYVTPLVTRVWADKEHRLGSDGTESSANLFDGNTGSKYYADGPGYAYQPPFTIEWDYSDLVSATSYSLTTANDAEDRDPVVWELYASVDESGDNYIKIDEQTDEGTKNRYETTTYSIDTPGNYRRFRLVVTKTRSGSPMQLSEIEVHGEEKKIDYSNYSRGLDLDNAQAYVSYESNNVKYTREYFVSNPDNVMVIKLDAEGGEVSKFFRITSEQTNKTIKAEIDNSGRGIITMEGQPVPASGWKMKTGFDKALYYAQELMIIPQGGSIVTRDDGIQVNNADSIVLIMSAGTNYKLSTDESFTNFFTGVDPMIAVKENVETAADKGYDKLKENHQSDYKELYDRVKIDFEGVSVPNKTTDELLANYTSTNTDEEDRYLEILYYQFGRYLLIASSRENSALPANLQGIWADGLTPPWSADYHTNINLQMNYWLAESTNLSETHIPVLEYVDSLVEKGTKGVQTVFGTNEDGDDIRGWTIWHENNPWGNVAPAVSDAFYSPEDAAWMCKDIWDYYEFNQDEEFLAENYQTLKEAALFWVDTLWEDTRDNTLVANPSYSPEHGPYSLGATEVQSVVWEIFDEVITASEILGVNDSEVQEIKTAQSRLSSPKIGSAGQFQEWKDDTLLDIVGDYGHRHVNHLFALHPGDQIVAGRSELEDQYVEAMKNTLNTRGDGGTGWSKAWKINFWARLLDGDHAQKMVEELLKESTVNSLLDVHPPFQIDGNFGATSGMTEMLLQSQGGIIKLLPALPTKWSSGSVSGLKARGNVEVDMEWTDENLEGARLKVNSDGELTVSATNIANIEIVKNGGKADYEKVDDDTIKINAKAGDVYSLGTAAQADTVDTNAVVEINGYQVSTTVEGFRTVYSISDPDGEVEKAGILYGIGNSISENDMIVGSSNSTIYSYEATAAGKLDASFSSYESAQSYSMTMKFAKSATFYTATMKVRAYAKLTDGTYIYSDMENFSVYNIAHYLYQNLHMNSLESHNYLYDNILSVVDSSYKEKDFAWNNSVVKPGDVKLPE